MEQGQQQEYVNKRAWLCSSKLHFRTLKFAFHIIFMYCEVGLFFLFFRAVSKCKKSLLTIQKQAAGRVPEDSNVLTPDAEIRVGSSRLQL